MNDISNKQASIVVNPIIYSISMCVDYINIFKKYLNRT